MHALRQKKPFFKFGSRTPWRSDLQICHRNKQLQWSSRLPRTSQHIRKVFFCRKNYFLLKLFNVLSQKKTQDFSNATESCSVTGTVDGWRRWWNKLSKFEPDLSWRSKLRCGVAFTPRRCCVHDDGSLRNGSALPGRCWRPNKFRCWCFPAGVGGVAQLRPQHFGELHA